MARCDEPSRIQPLTHFYPERGAARSACDPDGLHPLSNLATTPAPFIGRLLVATTALVVIAEWSDLGVFWLLARAGMLGCLMLLALRVGWSHRLFLAIAGALTVWAIMTLPDWNDVISRALNGTAFIAAFFITLACLHTAAAGSAAISQCGYYLANQPPGRRYLALTVGGHLFALVLTYGVISLFGSLIKHSLRAEPDEVIRGIRTRRMLLAVQRGFVAVLCWSPLSLAMVISVSVVPGASWSGVVPYGIVTALLLCTLGWSLDTLYRPRVAIPPHPSPPHSPDAWKALLPLFGLLLLLLSLVGVLQWLTGQRTVVVVMIVVPLLSLTWIMIQKSQPIVDEKPQVIRQRLTAFTTFQLPAYAPELVLLTMAGYIGTLAAALLAPWITSHPGAAETSPMVLIGVLWLVPLLGQIGMNPILAVTLIGPLLPSAAQLGVSPNLIVLALVSGWALGGASSPFSATTLLIGHLGGVSAHRVGLVWNGPFTLLGTTLISAWLYLMIST